LKPEQKLWQELKAKTPAVVWNRIENLALPGVPDLLGYNKNNFFFTVELKVVKSRKVRLSPHQIAFHMTHPRNSFILVKSLKPDAYKLYEGYRVQELFLDGLALDACCSGLAACCLKLESLGA
jgi:hypothetical protein